MKNVTPMKNKRQEQRIDDNAFNSHLERKTKHKHNNVLVRGQRANKRALQASYHVSTESY